MFRKVASIFFVFFLLFFLFPLKSYADGIFTASDYSFDPETNILSFTADNFEPPRSSETGEINDFSVALYNGGGEGQFVLDYFNYSLSPCYQGDLPNLTTTFNHEVCYNTFWHADLPGDDTLVTLRIAQGGSGTYRSQPIPANELVTSSPTPTGTPSTDGTFTASDYSFDRVTNTLRFNADNFSPPRSSGTDTINDFSLALYNGAGTGQFVLDYFNYSIEPCFDGALPNLTTMFDHEVCYNEFWHADLPTNSTPLTIRISQGGSGAYRSQPIPANAIPTIVTFNASGDTYVRSGQGNRNFGSGVFMRVQSSGDNRSLVRFDQTAMQSTISGTVLSAKLRLTISDNGNNWGSTGRTVDVHRLISDWGEGNGTENNNGSGAGATWNCALDSIISNSAKNCSGSTEWEMGQPNNPSVHPWVQTATDSELITNNQTGIVEYDVTADVAAFMSGTDNYGWLIRKTNEGQNGQVSFGTRESAFGPQLIVTYQP